LIEELYYILVPEEAWNKLLTWYGLVENQPPIPRKVVEYGMYVKHCKVEVYLIEFKLCQNSDMENVVTHQFSKADTLGIVIYFIQNTGGMSVREEKNVPKHFKGL
jgi:ubiquitin carboxyl-terminal hydrolase 4/11/15